MPCFYPLKGYRSKNLNASGKRSIVFNARDGFSDLPVTVPCGKCIGCRLERSRQWAMRCVHEASLYDNNCFITLTYDDDHLPPDLSLSVKHFQLFMKKLRKKYGPHIRFFHCGEYGEKYGRPHYHACLFNFDLPDRELWSVRDGVRLYTSESLTKIWGKGFATVGDVTFESAAYVARYVVDKLSISDHSDQKAIDAFDNKYLVLNCDTGELTYRKQEYVTMSRRPGIGKGWYDLYGEATHRDDFVVMRGQKMRPPKYYDGLFEHDAPDLHRSLKVARKKRAELHSHDNTSDRLRVRHYIQKRRMEKLPRNLN